MPTVGRTRIPFSTLDELFVLVDEPNRPVTIHLEARVDAHLDEQRLREATLTAASRHPLARARLRPRDTETQPYEWLVDRAPQLDPVRSIQVADPTDLDAVRGEFCSRSITLHESPPFRILLVHTDGGDIVMLSIHHSAADGVGVFRLLQSIGRAYAGVPDPTADINPGDAIRLALPSHDRGVADRLHERQLADRRQEGAPVVPQLSRVHSRPAKLASKDPSTARGYGVHSMSVPVRPLVDSPLRHRIGATVNDMILAAVHRTIDAWNTAHDIAPERVSISMPLNARPAAWRDDVVANIFSAESVSTTKAERQSSEECLRAVARWTEQVKRRGIGAGLAASTRSLVGDASERRGLEKRIQASVDYLADTVSLSNTGQLPADWVDSREFPVAEVWGTPPTVGVRMGMGAASTNDRLMLSFRHTLAVMSGAAAASFAGLLRAELDCMSGQSTTR